VDEETITNERDTKGRKKKYGNNIVKEAGEENRKNKGTIIDG